MPFESVANSSFGYTKETAGTHLNEDFQFAERYDTYKYRKNGEQPEISDIDANENY